jgi:hypothetical protein
MQTEHGKRFIITLHAMKSGLGVFLLCPMTSDRMPFIELIDAFIREFPDDGGSTRNSPDNGSDRSAAE